MSVPLDPEVLTRPTPISHHFGAQWGLLRDTRPIEPPFEGKCRATQLPAPLPSLPRGLGSMAWDAQRLQVGIIIAAALGDVNDVVDLKL